MEFFNATLLSRVSLDSDFNKLFCDVYEKVESCLNCRHVALSEKNKNFDAITLPFQCNSISEYMNKVLFQTGHILEASRNRRELEINDVEQQPLDCTNCQSGLSDDVMQFEHFPSLLWFCRELKSDVRVKTLKRRNKEDEFYNEQFIIKNKVYFIFFMFCLNIYVRISI